MLTATLEGITTLREFYTSIRSQQENYHGKEYCAHHDAITKYANGCESYKELGTHQGATAAAAVFAGFKKITLVDMNHYKIRPNENIFKTHCALEKIELNIIESTSLDSKTVSDVDLLLIDSRHTYNHCKKELALHGSSVKKYIVFHDTKAIPGVKRAVMEFVTKNKEWEVLEHYEENVVYSVIGRKQ
jgi:hypothetical protein